MLPAVYSSVEDPVVVARNLSEAQSAELSLVLQASGIEHQRVPVTDGWLLAVPAERAQRAAAEVSAYLAESARARRPGRQPPREIEHAGAWFGVGTYAAVLMVISILTERHAFGIDFRAIGLIDSNLVLSGEWWRCLTALTLHADTPHLLGNLGFGAFFGYFVGRYFGAGVGWSAIVGAGMVGNALNALLQPEGHLSLGASTAVFGALGVLTARAFRVGLGQSSWRARAAPLAAGIGLLAFTGTGGADTDIFAHLTGFGAGLAAGWLLTHAGVPTGPVTQKLCGLAAAAALALAWLLAVGRT
jgi:rhomboid protease GluP